MDVVDLSRRFSPRAIRRLVNRYRRQLVGGASLTAAVAFSVMLSVPVLANDGTATPLAACATPVVTPCAPDITSAGGTYTVALPGVGSLTVMVDPLTGAVSGATVSALTGFTAGTPTADEDGDKVSVTFTSTTDPTVVYNLSVKGAPPAVAGGPPTVTAKVKTPEKEDADEAGESAAETASEAAEHSTTSTISAPKGGSGEHHSGSGGGGGD
jgi:hypothetical protein